MKLLFEQNPSHKLVTQLANVFPDAVRVHDAGLTQGNDLALRVNQLWYSGTE